MEIMKSYKVKVVKVEEFVVVIEASTEESALRKSIHGYGRYIQQSKVSYTTEVVERPNED